LEKTESISPKIRNKTRVSFPYTLKLLEFLARTIQQESKEKGHKWEGRSKFVKNSYSLKCLVKFKVKTWKIALGSRNLCIIFTFTEMFSWS
jgi:hypothetical protein